MNQRRRSAAECIGFRYGWDIRDVSDMRYQAGRQKHAVYSMLVGYVCCPPAGEKPPVDREIPGRWDWQPDGEAYGRTVYFAKA